MGGCVCVLKWYFPKEILTSIALQLFINIILLLTVFLQAQCFFLWLRSLCWSQKFYTNKVTDGNQSIALKSIDIHHLAQIKTANIFSQRWTGHQWWEWIKNSIACTSRYSNRSPQFQLQKKPPCSCRSLLHKLPWPLLIEVILLPTDPVEIKILEVQVSS